MGTSLEWDFHSDLVKGYVIKADKQELRPFEINPATKSQCVCLSVCLSVCQSVCLSV